MFATLSPTPRGEYIFTLVNEVPAGARPFAVVHDDGIPTVVLEKSGTEAAGLPVDKTYTYLSLSSQADLGSIGVTAATAQVLSVRSVVANPIVYARHDRFFVQAGRVVEVAQLLIELGKNARGWLLHN